MKPTIVIVVKTQLMLRKQTVDGFLLCQVVLSKQTQLKKDPQHVYGRICALKGCFFSKFDLSKLIQFNKSEENHEQKPSIHSCFTKNFSYPERHSTKMEQ